MIAASALLLIAASLAATVLHFIMEPLRWNHCYLPVGHTAAENEKRAVRDALFCTALATYLLPFKLGIPLRVFLLRHHARLDLHFIGVVIALDGLLTVGVWTAATAFCVWITAAHWRFPAQVWWLALAIAVLVVAVVIALRTHWMRRILLRLQEARNLFDRPWRRVVKAGAVLCADSFSYGVRHALLILLVTGNVRLMLAGGAIGIIATFGGIVSGLPMGLVGYDATLIALLATVGVRVEQAVLIALINRGLNLAAATIVGIPAAMRLGLGSGISSILRKLRELSRERN